MKEQCRSCGEWCEEEDMYETDYRTYNREENEMVCEGCFDNLYTKCSKCGAIREITDLEDGICAEWTDCKEAVND
jgi:hypothetical protein